MKLLRPFALCFAILALVLGAAPSRSADEPHRPKGLRVFSAGHSFHVFMPASSPTWRRPAASRITSRSACRRIGGSRTIQHWDQPDDKNKTKAALKEGNVDVLTLSPIFHPDAGIDNFVKLGARTQPEPARDGAGVLAAVRRVRPRTTRRSGPTKVDRNARTVEEMKKIHAEYFDERGRAGEGDQQGAREAGGVRRAGRSGRDPASREDHRRARRRG